MSFGGSSSACIQPTCQWSSVVLVVTNTGLSSGDEPQLPPQLIPIALPCHCITGPRPHTPPATPSQTPCGFPFLPAPSPHKDAETLQILFPTSCRSLCSQVVGELGRDSSCSQGPPQFSKDSNWDFSHLVPLTAQSSLRPRAGDTLSSLQCLALPCLPSFWGWTPLGSFPAFFPRDSNIREVLSSSDPLWPFPILSTTATTKFNDIYCSAPWARPSELVFYKHGGPHQSPQHGRRQMPRSQG